MTMDFFPLKLWNTQMTARQGPFSYGAAVKAGQDDHDVMEIAYDKHQVIETAVRPNR